MSKILITRPMPKAVEDRARSMGDVTFRKETTPMSATEMVSALHEFDVVLPTLGDQFSAHIFDQVDAPHADDRNRFAAYVKTQHLRRMPSFPKTRTHHTLALTCAPCSHQHQGHRYIGCRVRHSARRICDHDPL